MTPRYMRDRLLVMYDERVHPSHPWLTKQAVEFLSHSLRSDDWGAEFGSGRSTLWFARRLRHLVSIESDSLWNENISRLLDSERLSDKVDYRECVDKKNLCRAGAKSGQRIAGFLLGGRRRKRRLRR